MSLLVTTVSSTETAEPIDRSVSADNWSGLPQQHTRLQGWVFAMAKTIFAGTVEKTGKNRGKN